ncbi:MAG: hypothetical protein ACRDRS_12415 [Pseudonocardiaceae bacterium]
MYAYNGRAVAQYVHTDFLYQAYFVACVNLLGGAGTSHLGDAGNPYSQFIDHTGTGLPLPIGMSGAPTDVGFGTFGAPAIATLVCEPATHALKHQWYQKWLVHRRLRPEEFGGHVEVQRLGRATYPFHAGVHWRTDANEANRLGEKVAIAMLEELGELFNEPYGGFSVTRFDGTTIRV